MIAPGPSQFDPAALHRPIDRMLSLGPAAIYAAHFGRLTNLTVLAADLHRLIDAHAEPGERRRGAGAERKRLWTEGVSGLVLAERERREWCFARGKVLDVFALDVELNAQGLESWLDSEGKRAKISSEVIDMLAGIRHCSGTAARRREE